MDRVTTCPTWRCWWPLAGMLVLAAAAAAARPLDRPVALACRDVEMPGDVSKLLGIAEQFGHGMGAALVLVTIVVLDRRRRKAAVRVACCAALAGVAATMIKCWVVRPRPDVMPLDDVTAGAFWGWLPDAQCWLLNPLEHDFQSFPSGHTAMAVGLAIGLCWLYPRGRWLFLALATLTAIQRMEGDAHFLSDTLAGAAVAVVVAGSLVEPSLLGRAFDCLERPKCAGSRWRALPARRVVLAHRGRGGTLKGQGNSRRRRSHVDRPGDGVPVGRNRRAAVSRNS